MFQIKQPKIYLKYCLVYMGIAVALFVFLVPLVWVVVSSFKMSGDIFSIPPTFIPKTFTIRQYIDVFTAKPIAQFFINSIIIASSSTILSLVFGTLAAYAFARTKSKSFNALLLVILSGRMLPGVALCIPLYILMRNLGLLDTYWALIIADTTFNLPFTIFMMSGYISQLPKEIEESGKIDGCTRLGILIYLITPLIGPGLGATAVLNFLMSWNEFLFAVVLTMSDTVKTIPVALISFDTGRNIFWGQMFAVITISLIPATLFTIFAQRYLVRGVTMGAVKG